MKLNLRSALGSAAMFVWIGFAHGQEPQPPINTPREETAERAARLPATSAVDPLDQALDMNSAEVALAKIAVTKSQNANVKTFANMMVKDHTDALSKLHAIQGVSPVDVKPNDARQSTADRISKLSGIEFDREYMRTVIFGHQELLEFYERQSNITSRSVNVPAGKKTLAQVSLELIPMARGHLQEAQSIQRDLATK